eukprot:scaffold843_cov143-Skeletonema_menzelii.AAC.1
MSFDSRIDDVHGARTLTCGVCKVCMFDTVEELENHQKSCDGLYREVFTCDVCTAADFDTLEEAVEHENKCRDDTRRRTEQSSRRQLDQSNKQQGNIELENHQKSCDGLYKEVFTCDVCTVADFDTLEEAVEHENKCRDDMRRRAILSSWQQLDQSQKQRESTIFVTIPPGKIGLTLQINKMGGATVTKVEANSTTGGKVHVDDRIISIDDHQIVNISDYAINQDKIRTLEVCKARFQQINSKSLKHALFTTSSSNKNNNCPSADLLPGPNALSAGNSSNIFTPLDDIANNIPTAYVQNYEEKQLSANLRPVEIPFDPLDENFDYSLERELAWLIEESAIILPQLAQTCASQPFILDYAWRHCSLELRSVIDKAFPRETRDVAKAMKVDMTDQEIRFRRSSSIERELNLFLSERVVDAFGEIAINKPPRRQRIRRKRLLNDDLILTADDVNQFIPSTTKTLDEIVSIAMNVPSELSVLEDEVAFLVEESLILLPDHMLSGSADNNQQNIITSVVSAGLSSYSEDINWNYVCANASEKLKQVLDKKGIKRRPLQRIIRYHESGVRLAFERRRVEICQLLTLDGYRREQTRANLPSNDLLKHVGLLNVMKLRLKYRLRSCGLSEQASKKDLRAACNVRNKRQRIRPKKKPIALDFTKVDPNRYSVLNATERELAFLREEFEMEYDHSCFDWDFIEKRSSWQLRQIMTERGVIPLGANPSVAGVSKLKKLVRLDSAEITHAFAQLRRDIRYALRVGFKRDSRRSNLPDLPPAPVEVVSTGTYVIDAQLPCDDVSLFHGVGTSWRTSLFRGEWKLDRDLHNGAAIHRPLLPSTIATVFELVDETSSDQLVNSSDGSSHQTDSEFVRESSGEDASNDDSKATYLDEEFHVDGDTLSEGNQNTQIENQLAYKEG